MIYIIMYIIIYNYIYNIIISTQFIWSSTVQIKKSAKCASFDKGWRRDPLGSLLRDGQLWWESSRTLEVFGVRSPDLCKNLRIFRWQTWEMMKKWCRKVVKTFRIFHNDTSDTDILRIPQTGTHSQMTRKLIYLCYLKRQYLHILCASTAWV